ncbi:Uncharacterized protein TCM_018221 [Theobroma cacao]|uniref:Uncharacterized protein n=1 Tax=Theobroma cacao TaxID=3641 RepID=A0A061ELY7_THECC|nr:Uncharacterized protein TCM_018221 [Theobroma cacao]
MGWIRLKGEIIFKSWQSLERMARTLIDLKEKDKEKVEKVTIKNYHPRKVFAIRDFPPGYGKGATPVSREDYVNEQQGENNVDEEDLQEAEVDPEDDPVNEYEFRQ